MYRTIYQVLASENLRAACTFRNAPVNGKTEIQSLSYGVPSDTTFSFSLCI